MAGTEHSGQLTAAIGQSSVPIGRTGAGEQVYGYVRSPEAPPVGCARLRDVGPPSMDTHAHDFLVLCYALRADATLLNDGR